MGNITFEIKMVCTITEEFFNSDEIQETKNQILSGEFKRDLMDKNGKPNPDVKKIVTTFKVLNK